MKELFNIRTANANIKVDEENFHCSIKNKIDVKISVKLICDIVNFLRSKMQKCKENG